jgi:polar amino acid transport system substrate-binding protein
MNIFRVVFLMLFVVASLNAKSIKVCCIDNLEPFMFLEKGEVKGATIDYMDIIAKHMNVKFEYVKTNSSKEFMLSAIKGECDLLPIIANPNKYDFLKVTKPYTTDHLVLVTKIQQPYINSLNELKNEKIGVYKDYKNVIVYLEKLYPHLNYVILGDDYLEAVKNGEVYGYIDSAYKLSYMILRNYSHELKIMKTIFEQPIPVSVGVRNGAKYHLEALNNAIDKFSIEEKNNIDSKWKRVVYKKEIDYELMFQILFVILMILAFYI